MSRRNRSARRTISESRGDLPARISKSYHAMHTAFDPWPRFFPNFRAAPGSIDRRAVALLCRLVIVLLRWPVPVVPSDRRRGIIVAIIRGRIGLPAIGLPSIGTAIGLSGIGRGTI